MRELARQVKKLRDRVKRDHQNRSTGSLIDVDYFALVDLLDYYDETRDAAKQTIIARDALEGVLFQMNLKAR